MRLRGLALVPFALVAAASVPASAGAATDGRTFLKGPYLHALGADRVEIRVELESAAGVVLEIAPGGGDKPSARDAGAQKLASKPATFHALLATGLDPHTRYDYSIRVEGAPAASAVRGSFVTAPRNDSSAPFSFLVYGDNRTDHGAHAAIVRAMKNEPADFLVHTGDFVHDGNSADDWQRFFDVESELLRDRCAFACVGNHELYDRGGALFLRYIGPGAQTADEKPRLYGSVRWSNTRFFFLNFMTDDREGEKAWLSDELSRADKETDLAWRIAVVHHGPWSSGPHGSSKRLHDMGIVSMLVEHKIDLVLSGHDHIYERGFAQKTRYLVSGGGGAPAYEIKETIPGSRKAEAARHYVLVSVTKDAIKTTAKRADGTILDACGFSSGAGSAGWDCDETVPATAATQVESKPPSVSTPPPSRCSCRTPGESVGAPSAAWGALAAAVGLVFRRRRPK